MAVERNSQLIDGLKSDFRQLYSPAHAFADAVGMLKMLPGIRGIWPGSAMGADGQLLDETGNGLHMTRSGLVSFRKTGLAPHIHYAGAQYHTRADESALDITGTEIYTNIKGLTVGAWVRFDNTASALEMILSKQSAAAGQRSWNINRLSNGISRFQLSTDGTAVVNVDSSSVLLASTWYFIAGRFTPSTEMTLWINDTKTTNTTSIPASIFSSTSNFEIASYSGGINFATADICLSFMCATAVPDDDLNTFFQFTAPLFGVTL
jgi:hypothetical protein